VHREALARSAPVIARCTPDENTGSRNAPASPIATQPSPASARSRYWKSAVRLDRAA
jgi:hypothetical protein